MHKYVDVACFSNGEKLNTSLAFKLFRELSVEIEEERNRK